MDKKSIGLIIGLIIFISLWQFVIIPSIPEEKMYRPAPVPPVTDANTQHMERSEELVSASNISQKIDQAKGVAPKTPAPVLVAEKNIELSTDIFHVRFRNKGAQMIHMALLDFHPESGSSEELLLVETPCLGVGSEVMDHSLKMEGEDQVLRFVGQKNEVTYRFKKGSHFFEMEIKNLNGQQQAEFLFGDVSSKLGGDAQSLARSNAGAVYALKSKEYGDNSAIYAPDSLKETPLNLSVAAKDLDWSGWRSKYFAWLLQPKEVNQAGHQLNYYHDGTSGQLKVNTTGQNLLQYQIYAGPIDKKVLYEVNKDLYLPLFNYTGIDVIIHFLLWLLSFYNNIPGVNMGFAIIILTITVKMCLFPLTLKSQTSMFMMSKLGPQVKELQEKFKNDRQMLGMKQMELFKKNGVNPLAGCLPMLIQMPVFISLFSTIGEGFDLRQAGFLAWINDLSAPDRFSIMEFSIPFIGNDNGTTNLNLLPFLYVVTMFIQQSLMPKSTDPQQQQMQKMMKFMMMGFAVILYNYSSGLMLYFVGSNILGMTESWYIRNKVMPKLEAKLNS
jgi:YidC/Oxa1 family membrane protein insertase